MRFATVMVALATPFAVTAPAHAGSWSPPAQLHAGASGDCSTRGNVPDACFIPAGTRIAVNAGGEAIAIWADDHFVVRAAYTRRNGNFGPAHRLGKGLRAAVVLRDDGSAVAAWSTNGPIHVARSSGSGRFGPSQPLAPTAGTDDDVNLLARPDGTVVAVYDSVTSGTGAKVSHQRVRTVDLPRTGLPGARITLGKGSMQLAAGSPAGGIAVYGSKMGLKTRAPDSETWTAISRPDGLSIESLAAADDGPLLGVVDPLSGRGSGGYHGRPGATQAAYGDPLGAPQFAPVVKPTRAFGPVVAADGENRTVLLYRENPQPEYSSNHGGPLFAVSAPAGEPFGPRIRLDPGQVYEPFAAPLPHGALIAWSSNRRWRVATLRDGVLHRVSAPAGGPGGFFAAENIDQSLATAGGYAALVWRTAQGAVLASVARIG
jgi:hypothetical protein